MDALGSYFKQNPLALPIHAVAVTVETKRGCQGNECASFTFTVLRSRACELLKVLTNVDFERLSIVASSFEINDAVKFLSLDGPLCPAGLAADVTDAVPFTSMWNAQDGHIRKLPEKRAYRANLVMKLLHNKKVVSGQPLQREEVPAKAGAVISKTDFEEIVIEHGSAADDDESLAGKDEKIVKLKDLFDQVDIDASGEIVLEEMRIVLKDKGYSDDFIEHLFYHMDLNKDKMVKRAEFYQALRIIPIEIFSSDKAQSDEQLMRYFDEFDADKNGTLVWSEFQAALLQRGMTEEFIAKYFSDLDLDQSKAISRNEYARCIGLRWKADKN